MSVVGGAPTTAGARSGKSLEGATATTLTTSRQPPGAASGRCPIAGAAGTRFVAARDGVCRDRPEPKGRVTDRGGGAPRRGPAPAGGRTGIGKTRQPRNPSRSRHGGTARAAASAATICRPSQGLADPEPSARCVAERRRSRPYQPRVAQALFVTPKTVELHLRNAYGKHSSSLGAVHPNPPSRSVMKPSTETLIENDQHGFNLVAPQCSDDGHDDVHDVKILTLAV